MKEFIEKLIGRLEEEKKIHTEHYNISLYRDFPNVRQRYKQTQLVIDKAILIVNELAEEYINTSTTNADRIRSMTDEELAEFLLKVNTAYAEPCMIGKKDCKWEDYPTHDKGCKDCFLDWLQSEVEGGADD